LKNMVSGEQVAVARPEVARFLNTATRGNGV
jgi:hypothetical protein